MNVQPLRHVEAREMRGAHFRYFDYMMVAFVVVLLLSNVIGAEKRSFITLPGIGAWRNLWMRFWGSTIVGEGFDSLIFYPLAFYGMADWPVSALAEVMLSQFVLKVSWEVLLTPVTYAVVGWLKRKEGVDVYDVGTSFTPFTADL